MIRFLVRLIIYTWILICAPLAIILFFFKECNNLADIIASKIANFLEKYN